MKKVLSHIIALLLSVFCFTSPCSASVSYEITDLGAWMTPYALNDSTELVGWTWSFPPSNFYWKDSLMTELAIPGPTYLDPWSIAYDINDSGRIVGYFGDCYYSGGICDGKDMYKAVYWEHGTGHLFGDYIQLKGVNDLNQMVGATEISGYERATYWDENGLSLDLGTLGGSTSSAFKINDSGAIVGWSTLSSSDVTHAFLWENGTMIDLGTLGGLNSFGQDINNNGLVVGYEVLANDETRTFLWDGSVLIDIIPNVSSTPGGINGEGQIVGSANNMAYIWDNGQLAYLQDLISGESGWELNQATDINNKGEIIGVGILNGNTHAFLLTPQVIPEPVSAILALIGGGAMFLRRKIGDQKTDKHAVAKRCF